MQRVSGDLTSNNMFLLLLLFHYNLIAESKLGQYATVTAIILDIRV